MNDPKDAVDAMEAIKLADKLRRDHNGIMLVTLHLGHDGHNVCILQSGAEVLGEYSQGGTLLSTVQRAAGDWRLRNLTTTTWGRDAVKDALMVAVGGFEGLVKDDAVGGVFNSAQFQHAINNEGYAPLAPSQCQALLEGDDRVVRLFGGAHWFLLPKGHRRYDESQPKAANTCED